MRKDRFTDEAVAAARALADLKMNDPESFAEAYDFARCKRLDGTTYPIAEGKQCRRGRRISDAEPAKKKSTAKRKTAEAKPKFQPSRKEWISYDKRKTAEAKPKAKPSREELISQLKARQQRLARGKKFIMKARQGMKRLEAQYRMAVGRPGGNPGKIMDAMKRLRKQAEKVGAEMEKLMPGTKGKGQFYVP